jgi:hypothetical protein
LETGWRIDLLEGLVGSIVVVSSSIGFCADTDEETGRGDSTEPEAELD